MHDGTAQGIRGNPLHYGMAENIWLHILSEMHCGIPDKSTALLGI